MRGEHAAVGPPARTGFIAAAIALAAIVVTGPAASADTVGAVATTASAWGCAPGLDLIQASPAGTYTVTTAGTITAWSTVAGPHVGGMALTVWRPTSTPNTWALVAVTADQVPTTNMTNNFSLGTNTIAVLPGDIIGVRTTSGIADCLIKTGVATDEFLYSTTQVTATGATETFPPTQSNTTFALNILAALTPVPTPAPNRCGDGEDQQGDEDCQGNQGGTERNRTLGADRDGLDED